MNIEQLRAFCTVSRTMSFTEAAKILSISQPAVSRQISTLEEEIGAKLFKRIHNVLILTRAGEMLYEELPQKIAELEQIFFNAKLINLGKIRRIKVGVLRDQCPDPQFLEVCRNMRSDNYYVRIQQYDFMDLENAVMQRDIDVAVSLLWVPDAFRDCSKKIYRTEELCLVVNTEFSPEVPAEINRETLEKFSKERPTMVPGTNCFQKAQLGEVSKFMSNLWVGITEEDVDVIIPMVQSGIGSALVNSFHILSTDKAVLFKPIEFLKPIKKGIFWLDDNPNDAVLDFVDRMKKAKKTFV